MDKSSVFIGHICILLRCGICGAWSFNEAELKCYLHNADSCCGQKGKREENSEWTSGYACSKCWSTEAGTECHCSLKQRQQGPLGCAGIAQSGTKPGDPDYTSATVRKKG